MRKLAVYAGAFSLGIFLAQYLLPPDWLLPGALVCLGLGWAAFLLPWEVRRRCVAACAALALALGWNWLYVLAVQAPMEALAETGRGWQKNTVITLLSRLTDKGFLTVRKLGRRNEYAAAVSEAEYQAAQTQVLVNKLYAGSAMGLVAALIRQEAISPGDYEELKRFWEEERNGHG